jgi:hypothetical protein
MGVTSWDLGASRVPLIMVPDTNTQLFGWGVWLPKALAESKKQVLALSSFSVTLLRLKVYYLLIHGIKQF